MKYVTLAALVLLATGVTALAQTPPASQTAQSTQSAPAFSPAKSIGTFAYPKNGQNADQQLKSESECYRSAKEQSGVDPRAPHLRPSPLTSKPQSKKQPPTTPIRPKGVGPGARRVERQPGRPWVQLQEMREQEPLLEPPPGP